MTRFTSNLGRAAMIVILGATASACGGSAGRIIDRADAALTMKAKSSYSMYLRPQADAGSWRASVAFRQGSSRFRRGGKAHIGKFVRTTTPMAHEWVSVAIPGGATPEAQALAQSRAKRIRKVLARKGVRNTRVTFDSDIPGSAVLTFYRARAIRVSCPEWRNVAEGRHIKFKDWKFGCLTAGALGASAYSRDLSRPGHLGKSTGEEAAIVATADRKGELDPGKGEASGTETSGGSQ